MKRRQYMKKLIAQKLIGIIMLIICALCIIADSKEATIVLLLAPLGIYLLCTHRIWIY